MKQLLLVRHAKSDWEARVLTDHDRPLNKKGHLQAPAIAQQFLRQNILIDAFISSTAVRAFTTANYFAEAYKIPSTQIITEPNLYNAPIQNYHQIIPTINNKYNSIALFAHNPGITQIANSFSKKTILEMPTCGVCIVQANCKTWKEFLDAPKELVQFIFP